MSGDDISSPEGITILRSELISFFRNQLPEALIADDFFSAIDLFEVVLLLGKCGGNHAFLFGVLEIDDIM